MRNNKKLKKLAIHTNFQFIKIFFYFNEDSYSKRIGLLYYIKECDK